MAKMWAGRTDGVTEKIADDFNSSIQFDSRMYRQDITGSMTHAAMLAAPVWKKFSRIWNPASSPLTWNARTFICLWSRC